MTSEDSDSVSERNLALWTSTKYVSWPYVHANPIVRVPTPSGQPESRSIPHRAGVSEQVTFRRCVQYRDKRGVEIWGKQRWAEMLKVQARSVARHRESPAGPQTGVFLYERSNSAPVWIATWYELLDDGSRRKRSKEFSFGTARAKCGMRIKIHPKLRQFPGLS